MKIFLAGNLAHMSNSVSIKSAKDATRLTFAEVKGELFVATLESLRFSGRVVVSTYISGPPSLLFDEMAGEWRGRNDEKRWVALDNNLRLHATSDLTGHVYLRVALRDDSDPADWCLEAGLLLEAGQLEELARTVKKVFQHLLIA